MMSCPFSAIAIGKNTARAQSKDDLMPEPFSGLYAGRREDTHDGIWKPARENAA